MPGPDGPDQTTASAPPRPSSCRRASQRWDIGLQRRIRGLGRPLQLARPDTTHPANCHSSMARGSSLAPRRRHRLPWLPGLQPSRSASSPRSVSREVWLARGRHPALSSASPTPPGAALTLLMTVASLHSGLWGSGHSLSDPCSQLTNPAWTIFETRSHFSRCYPAGHARIRPLFRNRASNPTANNEQNEPAPSQLTGGHPHTVSSRLLQPTEASASLREAGLPFLRALHRCHPRPTHLPTAVFYLRTRTTHQPGSSYQAHSIAVRTRGRGCCSGETAHNQSAFPCSLGPETKQSSVHSSQVSGVTKPGAVLTW